jgi:hypothetical protein
MSDIAIYSLQEMNVDVIFGLRELICLKNFICAREEVYFGTEDVWEEGLKKLKKYVFEYDLRQGALLQYDEPFAFV